MRPQPILVSTQIIIVGTPDILRMLQRADEDFRRYFKVVADFDTVMERTPETLTKYAAFISARCSEKGLKPFHKTAIARVIDHSSRLVEHQNKLTTRFIYVVDVITEADYWAGFDESETVMGEHVSKAIEQRRCRSSLT